MTFSLKQNFPLKPFLGSMFLAPSLALPYCGILTAIIYLIFAGFYSHHALRWVKELFVWPAVLSLLFIYWQGFLTLKNGDIFTIAKPAAVKTILLFGGLFAVINLFIAPFHSTDIFGYINRGWEQAHYGLNPYVHPIEDIPGWDKDPMITDHWANNPSPYGFLFMLITKTLCPFGAGNLALTLLLFKAVNLLFWIATGCLIWQGTRRLKLPKPELSLYLFLWNPLLLLHLLANGHNDIVMGFFMLLTGYLVIIDAWLWVMPALFSAVFIKYAAVTTIPIVLLWLQRRYGLKRMLLSLMLGMGLALLVASPYLGEFSRFRFEEIGANAIITHNSLHSVFYNLFKISAKLIHPLHAYRFTVQSGLKMLLLAGYGLFLISQWRTCLRLGKNKDSPAFTAQRLLEEIFLNQFLLIVVVSAKFYPWYLGMFLPLAFYLPWSNRLRWFSILLSCTLMLAFTFIGQAYILNYGLMVIVPFLCFYFLRVVQDGLWRTERGIIL